MSSRSTLPRVRAALVLPVFAAAVAAQAAAELPAEVSPLPPRPPITQPFVTVAQDGTVWARGADWKASFGHDGVAFVPFLGSDAPRNFPLRLQLAAVVAGDEALSVAPAAARAGDARVDFDHGTFVETWLLARDGVEQRFVFRTRIGDGPLAVRMQVTSELQVASDGDGGFRFANERGGVRYGRAIAFDAAGRRTDVQSQCDGATLSLTVPAAFVAEARFPLTIDPLVQTFSLIAGQGAPDESNTDCAYVGSLTGLYATVHEEHFSQTDHDVYVNGRDRDGVFAGGTYVDYTSDNWTQPAIASHRGASQFLVVATKGPSNLNTRVIHGCTVTWYGGGILVAGTQFPVHTFGNGMNPDVGGDPNPSPSLPGHYCVTWTGTVDGELNYRIVRTDGSMPYAVQWLDFGTEFVSNPAISKSCGVGAQQQQEWVIVWQKRYAVGDDDIYGTRIAQDGTIRTLEFLIDYSGQNDTNPEVSSLTDTTGAGVERFAVVYQRDFPSTPFTPAHIGVMGQLFQATTSVTGTVDLKQLLGGGSFANWYDPCVDTDGQRFCVGFTKWSALLSANSEPYLATIHVTPAGAFDVTALPELLNAYHGPDEQLHVTSERSGGSFTPNYLATWHTQHTTPPSGAGGLGARYRGHIALGPTSYFNHSLPGCGTLQITASGLPAIANAFTIDLTGASGIPVLLFGAWLQNPITWCGNCVLGVDLGAAVFLQTTSVTVMVPPDTSYLGLMVGAQGIDVYAPNGCTSPIDFTLSDMLLITLL